LQPLVPECPRCRRSMEQGFLLDRGRNRDSQTQWIAGAPESGFFIGLKLRGKRRVPVTTFRCATCGRLESYAWEA
jgi:hypothetical protein